MDAKLTAAFVFFDQILLFSCRKKWSCYERLLIALQSCRVGLHVVASFLSLLKANPSASNFNTAIVVQAADLPLSLSPTLSYSSLMMLQRQFFLLSLLAAICNGLGSNCGGTTCYKPLHSTPEPTTEERETLLSRCWAVCVDKVPT